MTSIALNKRSGNAVYSLNQLLVTVHSELYISVDYLLRGDIGLAACQINMIAKAVARTMMKSTGGQGFLPIKLCDHKGIIAQPFNMNGVRQCRHGAPPFSDKRQKP
ncbi:hypothetical protein VIFL103355_22280 [Vibrio fluvialis]